MEEDKLKYILEELYNFEPSLKEYQAQLVKIIKEMALAKPDTKFDQSFAYSLKLKILNESKELSEAQNLNNSSTNKTQAKKLFNFTFMNKKIYITAGSLVALSLLFVALINYYQPSLKEDSALNKIIKSPSKEVTISKLPAGAFGSLSDLSSNSAELSRSGMPVLGMGSSDGAAIAPTAEANFAVNDILLDKAVSSDMAIEPIGMGGMILPFYGFKYSYVGDPLELNDGISPVYRRVKSQGTVAKDLARTLRSFGFSDLNLSGFQNLQVTNLSLAEDKELGLLINFDFNEENVYIYENWRYWRNPERESCGGDSACWDRFRLTLNDIPGDNELISLANNFLQKHKISLDNYSTPRVDNNWREEYSRTVSKADFYIPESISVVYPLLINGEEVRDQIGNFAGLRVNINVPKKAVHGLNGLFPYRYEASDYEMETSVDKVLQVVENGGWNQNFYIQEENVQILELGTPERAYVQLWRYDNISNNSDELLVPSLIFPIVSEPNTPYYFYQRYVIVPLVKEMLTELSKRPDVMPMPILRDGGDMVEPALPVDGGGNSGSIDSSPSFEGEFRILPIEIMEIAN